MNCSIDIKNSDYFYRRRCTRDTLQTVRTVIDRKINLFKIKRKIKYVK